MTKHFNKKEIKPARRSLRRNAPLAEKLIWHYIRKKQICGERFLRQYSVDYYVIDFYCPRLKLAVEADGPSHFSSIKAIKYDEKRQKHLEDFGISFLRFTNDEIYQDLENVISKIEERVKELQKIKG
ncbi:hypothetical protein BMS3Abin03_01300 [bacterium BMS3Abin03]|nr:hypothetical protein BMS3Abin03_01300 [bacterium BMS3Abin03]